MGNILHRHGKLYVRWYGLDGKQIQRATTAKDVKEARAILLEKEREVQMVRDGRLERPTGPTDEERRRRTVTVNELADRFLGLVDGDPGYAPPKIKDLAEYRQDRRSAFKVRILPTLGAMPAAGVSTLDVERLRDKLIKRGLAAASVVQTLAMLSRIYTWGKRTGLLACQNPVQGVERLRTEPTLDFLDKAEVGRLLATAEAMARPGVASHAALMLWPMVAVAIFTGVRKGEIAGLRWRDIALDAGRLDVLHSYTFTPKSGKARHLPLPAEAARALRAWRPLCPATPEALVFPVEADVGRFRMGTREDGHGIVALLELAGCHLAADGHNWHLLRHTFASHAVMSGASLYDVQRLLGHATPTMTQRYAHLSPDHLAAVVARLDFTLPAPAGVSDLAAERTKRAG